MRMSKKKHVIIIISVIFIASLGTGTAMFNKQVEKEVKSLFPNSFCFFKVFHFISRI